MSGTDNLGINPDAIDSVYGRCKDAIQEMRDFADEIGCDEVVSDLDNLDFDNKALEHFKSNLDGKNITSAITSSCLEVTKTALKEASNCMEFDLDFDTIGKGENRSLIFMHDKNYLPMHKGRFYKYENKGDMERILNDTLSFWLYQAILNCADSSQIEHLRNSGLHETIEDSVYDGYYSKDEIAACLHGEIKGHFKELVDAVVAEYTKPEPATKHTKNEPSLD